MGSKMLEGDAGIVGISSSPMNSLAAISSSSSWSELASEFESEEPGSSVWRARLVNVARACSFAVDNSLSRRF